MEAYKRWIRRNKDSVHHVNTITNYLTWLLPDKFYDSEIGPEAVSTILSVVSTFNEHIIETTPNEKNKGPAGPSGFSLSLCISVLKELEILLEVTAEKHYGNTRKWDFIAAIEALKVVLRLALFNKSGYRMILNGGHTPNIGQKRSDLEARAITALSRFRENARVMKHPALAVDKPSISSVLSTKGFRGALFLLGELLFITRPLMYVLLVRKYATRSWIPWILSLSVDFLGVGVFSPVSFSGRGSKDEPLLHSDMEKSEMRRRKMLWILYIIRDPFFTKYIRKRFDKTRTVLEPVPVIGILADRNVEGERTVLIGSGLGLYSRELSLVQLAELNQY